MALQLLLKQEQLLFTKLLKTLTMRQKLNQLIAAKLSLLFPSNRPVQNEKTYHMYMIF